MKDEGRATSCRPRHIVISKVCDDVSTNMWVDLKTMSWLHSASLLFGRVSATNHM